MNTRKTCELCGHELEMRRGPGRTHEYRVGLKLPVPDDFEIPTCPSCEETYLSEDGYSALEEAQKPAFIEWQKGHVADLIQAIRDAHPNVRLRDIERACDVTGTYLSHVLGGRNAASQPLINLLEAFALYPAEFERQLQGRSWRAAYEGLRRNVTVRYAKVTAEDLLQRTATIYYGKVAAPAFGSTTFKSTTFKSTTFKSTGCRYAPERKLQEDPSQDAPPLSAGLAS